MQRFFLRPDVLQQLPIVMTGEQAHQVRRVLRMHLGDRVVLLDGEGWAYEAVLIAYGADDVKFQAVRHWEVGGEPGALVTLYQAVIKGERFAWTLQKGTEIGISHFVPMVCERNVVDDLQAIESKRERWERIIMEAAEQAERATLPVLGLTRTFTQAVLEHEAPDAGAAGPPLRLLLWEGERQTSLRDVVGCNLATPAHIQLYVGPEGGFTDGEVRLARRHGIQTVSLGPRILRAETAGIAATAAILYAAGDMAAPSDD